MPQSDRPIQPSELVSAARFNISTRDAELFLKGMSPGLGTLSDCILGFGILQSRRYQLPRIEFSDRRAVALRASALLGSNVRGEPHIPWTSIVEAFASQIGLASRFALNSPQVGIVGRAVDQAHAELLAERAEARAAE